MVVKVINSFEEFNVATNSGRPVLIDFWATWCAPCRAISPVFENYSNLAEHKGMDFYKVDVDEQQDIAQELGIKSMPTFLLYKDGQRKSEVVGAVPAKLQALVKSALDA